MNVFNSPLKTILQVSYITASDNKETDITQDVSADLLSCSYIDKVADEADELTITLKDETGKWAGSWSPTRGDYLDVTIATQNGGILNTGKMVIDRYETSGRPRVFSVSAVSIPLNTAIRRDVKDRSFENIYLKDLANKIAGEHSLEFLWDCEDEANPVYERTDQKKESDLDYLNRLCKDAGLTLKVSAMQLIIFDELSYEKKDAVATLIENVSNVLDWSFTAQQSEHYRAVTVQWRNVVKKTKTTTTSTTSNSSDKVVTQSGMIWDRSNNKFVSASDSKSKGKVTNSVEYTDYTYIDETVDSSGQVFVMKKKATSQKEAERLAKAKLRGLNKRELTGNLTIVGNPQMVAGVVVNLQKFGSFDGNFFIEGATHTVSGMGYTTALSVHRVNTNY